MKPCLLILILAWLTTGCLSGSIKTPEATPPSNVLPTDVQSICEEMNSIGSISSLIKELKRNTKEICQLLSSKSPLESSDRIEKIASEISEISSNLQSLSRSEWTELKNKRIIQWKIDELDLRVVNGSLNPKIEIVSSQMMQISLMGRPAEYLLHNFIFTQDSSTLSVTYKYNASALDLCQLEKTLVATVKLVYNYNDHLEERVFHLITEKN